MTPEAVITKTAFGDKAVDMRVPFEIPAEGMILSILVDTFFSSISLTMRPVPNPHNTACVLS